ncbi:MAG TPA: hypothetical protein VFG59_01685 [Anaeromyxobacter sp.]|nr:hypothetical protein [Anaeromyxobacter sp.]
MLRLGEILVKDGACTAEEVREALKNQVIFGGRLGTNLLELGAVAEDVLGVALGKRYGAPALWGDLPLDPAAVKLLRPDLADRFDAVPYALSDRKLALLACNPSDLRMLDEVSFATGHDVHPVVVPEARIWRLLERAYGVRRELRGIEVDFGGPVAEPPGPAAPAPPGGSGDDLMGEADFEALYGRRVGEGPLPEEEVLDLTDEVIDSVPAASDEALPTPLDFAEATRALAGAGDRYVVAGTVLRYARSRFLRSLLLAVSHGWARGFVGLGPGLSPDRVGAIRLRLSAPGVLSTVVSTRAHFLGPLARTEANIRLLKALGGGVPHNALVVPILALGRVVNVFYADAGRGGTVEPAGVGELLILSTRIAQGYEALVSRRVR